jgi:ABC-type nitrate/sulfonate/bicarbonate transport system substrate-binding protein
MLIGPMLRYLAATAFFLMSLTTLAQAQDKPTIRLGVLYPNLVTVIHHIAKETGAYERAGVNVVERRFPSGQTVAGVELLLKGDLDLYIGAGPETVRANAQAIGIGQKPPLSVLNGANPGHTTFVLSNKIQAKSIEDLKGKHLRIAVSSPSSVHLALFRGFLRNEKHMTTDELGWRFLPVQAANMIPALLTNQIDGFLHSEPTPSLAVHNKAGWVCMYAKNGDMGPNPPPATFLSANRAWVAQHEDAVRRFMRAMQDANKTFETTPKEKMIPIINSWAKQDPELMELVYDRLSPEMSMSDAQAHRWWDIIGHTMVERGEIPASLKFEDVFDLHYQ